MTVRLADAAVIALEGACPIEDAETLLRHLLAAPHATVDWRRCEQAHAAVVQVLLASGVTLRGPPQGALLRLLAAPSLLAGNEAAFSGRGGDAINQE
jgi:hypothetical protein